MNDLFKYQDTIEVVANKVQEITSNATKTKNNANKEKKKDYKTIYSIQATIDVTNFEKISHVENGKQAWDILIKHYKGSDKVNGDNFHSIRR